MKKNLLLTLLASSVLVANQQDDLEMLSLEELMNVPITTVSKRQESQHLAAGVVTIISASEIKQFGARHLRDVLDRVVGVQVLGSHQDPHSKTSMRGFNSSHHEGHTLILLNGRPVRQATDGGLNSDFYLGFPLNVIDHIEVVRGPGSVIHGTNAVAGVVNIITKNAKEAISETRVDLGYGSFNRTQAQLSTLIGGEDYSINIGANYITSDGDTVSGIQDELGNIGDYKSGQESKNILISGEYKQLTFDIMYMSNQLESASSVFQLPSKEIDLKRTYIDLGYTQNLYSGWDLEVHYTHQNDSAEWTIIEALGDNRSDGSSHLVEAILRGNISSNLNILIGALHAENTSEFQFKFPGATKTSLPKTTITNTAAYVQTDYMLSSKQKIIAGVQVNKPNDIEADFSFRAGFIQGIGDDTWLKLLYSEAYRSPTIVETSLNAPALMGNPLLDPEKVYTYDLQLLHNTDKTSLALTLYHSQLENQIVRWDHDNNSTTPLTQKNEGYTTFNGVEFEGRYQVSKKLNLTGNFSYQENETDSGVKQSTYAPNYMAKIGATYSGINATNLSVFNSLVGPSSNLGEVIGDTSININPEAKAYNLLTANIMLDTGTLLSIGKPKQSTLSIYLDNLLDEKVYSADLNFRSANNTIPAHWGRGIYANFTYKFQ
ncbi:TonB-dependent receptor [Sulfurimonas aquatica]|uniref:TonB-dependent receptor n=1 Tax=Sulfurimonas aquatica TaxID=2672570 RepID=A0A975GDK6_9BACT|nr:TonB-dependent receptor [Sulfurimonas aquatica]QSZ42414.1 TonB-dependent receptor [Sulfurimonas aquatica]